jgi:hypothetical protein
MRIVVGILVFAGIGAIALADPPAPPPTQSATSTPSAPAASPTPSAPSAPSAPATPSASAASPAPAANPSHATTAAGDPREKMLRSKGYHLETFNGEMVFCRTEAVMGSRLGGKKTCGTVEELAEREYRSKELAASTQRNQLNPTGK